jgi:hypothetical protein
MNSMSLLVFYSLAFAQTGFRGFCNEKLAPSVRHMVLLV